MASKNHNFQELLLEPDWLYLPALGSRDVRALIAKINAITRRCPDRSSDSIAMFKSVFVLISAMATFNARWRRFAETGRGASRTRFPSASFIESNPSTVRRCSKEMRLLPTRSISSGNVRNSAPAARHQSRLRSPVKVLAVAACPSALEGITRHVVYHSEVLNRCIKGSSL
jgi:hypothetical protein